MKNTFNSTPDSKAVAASPKDDEETKKYNPELAIPVVISGTDRYDTSRATNGSAIIFNFEDFYDHQTYLKREGSQADVDRLLEVFDNLDIDIQDRIHKNMTYNSMQQRLKECKNSNEKLC